MSKDLTTQLLINEVPYYVKYGTMSMIEFGKMSGLPIKHINNLAEMQLEQMYQLYYSGLVAGCKLAKVPCLSWDEFLMAIELDESIMTTLQELRTVGNLVEGN